MKCPFCDTELSKSTDCNDNEFWWCDGSCEFCGRFYYPEDVAATESALSAARQAGYDAAKEQAADLVAKYPIDSDAQEWNAIATRDEEMRSAIRALTPQVKP